LNPGAAVRRGTTFERSDSVNQTWAKGKWNEVKGKVKEQWGDLTDDQLDKIEGQRDQLVGLIQQEYGRTRDDVEREIAAWEKRQETR
jgi:uncharacterized protein YjbJ (UPF0337 family)